MPLKHVRIESLSDILQVEMKLHGTTYVNCDKTEKLSQVIPTNFKVLPN